MLYEVKEILLKDNSKPTRERRAAEAKERQADYAKLSLEEKLERAKAFNPASAETARLTELLKDES